MLDSYPVHVRRSVSFCLLSLRFRVLEEENANEEVEEEEGADEDENDVEVDEVGGSLVSRSFVLLGGVY